MIIRKSKIDAKKVVFIPPAIDLDVFLELEKENSFSYNFSVEVSQKKKILYLGALDRIRKLDFLLRVFKKVILYYENVELILVGKSAIEGEEQFLKEKVKEYGLKGKVIFTGQLPKKEAWELVKSADVCVSPIYPHEIFNVSIPTKLLEYMALGRPVVANNQPMQKYLLEKSGAGLCVNYDEDEFANAILYLLKNPEKAK